MDNGLALSGESAPLWVLRDFPAGVGLVRGEYILRDLGADVTVPAVPPSITSYLRSIAGSAAPAPVWYRTSDLDAGEAAVLDGAAAEAAGLTDEDVRGVRRGLRVPELLRIELAAFQAAQRLHPNLRLLFPFVTTPEEADLLARFARHAGIAGPLGVMAETPAAVLTLPEILARGFGHVLIGCNDLWALTMGQARRPGNYPTATAGLTRMVELARKHTADHGVSLHMAGYLDPSLLRMADETGVDAVIYHYADLPKFFGERYRDLPDLDWMHDVKRRSRAAVVALRAAR